LFSSFFFSSSFLRGIQVEYLNSEGKTLHKRVLPLHGDYSIKGLSSKLKIGPPNTRSLISFKNTKNKFSLSSSPLLKIKSDEYLWDGKTQKTERVHFTWAEIPPQIKIIFPNQSLLKISEGPRKPLQALQAYKTPLLLSLIIVFHLVLGLMVQNFDYPEAYTGRDISKVQVSLASPIYRGIKSPPLFQNWSVGKPIKDANQVLKPRWEEKAFRKYTRLHNTSLDNTHTWNIESPSEKKLNLSETQIAKALQPVQASLQNCYDDVLIRDATLRGRPRLLLEVGPHKITKLGIVRDVEISNFKAKKESIEQLQACFLKAYQKAKLPPPNQDFLVTYTLVLSQ